MPIGSVTSTKRTKIIALPSTSTSERINSPINTRVDLFTSKMWILAYYSFRSSFTIEITELISDNISKSVKLFVET